MIPRTLQKHWEKTLKPGRVWMLFGARRVGKTQLVNNYLANQTGENGFPLTEKTVMWPNC